VDRRVDRPVQTGLFGPGPQPYKVDIVKNSDYNKHKEDKRPIGLTGTGGEPIKITLE
jgi:hypothetical protein